MSKNSLILMYDGSVKEMQDICIADKLMGDDSTPRNVLYVLEKYDKIYKIIPDDLSLPYYVNGSDFLCLKDCDDVSYEISVKNYYKDHKNQSDFKLYKTSIEKYSNEYTTDKNMYDVGFNDIVDSIPHRYMIMSKENRKSLLAGILQQYGGRLYEPNEKFANQIIFLARSLGCFAIYNAEQSRIELDARRELTYSFRIKKTDKRDLCYYLKTDGNHNYVMENFTIMCD